MNSPIPAASHAPDGPTNRATIPAVTDDERVPRTAGQSALMPAIPSTVVPMMISGPAAGITP